MRIGILGSGVMGGKLGTIFAKAGHEAIFSYSRSQRKLKRLARKADGHAQAGTPREAAVNADALMLAVHWSRIADPRGLRLKRASERSCIASFRSAGGSTGSPRSRTSSRRCSTGEDGVSHSERAGGEAPGGQGGVRRRRHSEVLIAERAFTIRPSPQDAASGSVRTPLRRRA